MEEEQLYDRIGETDFNPTYVDGQTFLHTDVNKIVSITKEGVNENYYDIQRLQNGTKSVGNAVQFDGATLSKYLDEPLQANDAKVPTSQQVKEYVDGLFSDFSAPVRGVDYWTEDDKQEIIDEASEGVESEIDGILEDYAKLTDIPSNISSFTNDRGYLVEDNLQMVETIDVENSSQITDGTGYARLNKIYGDTQQEGTPTPDNPIDIEVVTGDIEINISNSDSSSEQNYLLSLGDIELCKIGNIQDYIYEDNGDWYLKKYFNRKTFDGSTSDSYEYSSDLTNTIGINLKPDAVQWNVFRFKSTEVSAYCDAISYTVGIQDYEHFYITGGETLTDGYNGNLRVYFAHSRLNGYSSSLTNAQKLALVKTYLSENPFTFVYIMKNSITQKITDLNLINQLNEMKNFILYETESNFLITASDLTPHLNITYAITNREIYSKYEVDDLLEEQKKEIENTKINLDRSKITSLAKLENICALPYRYSGSKGLQGGCYCGDNLVACYFTSTHTIQIISLITGQVLREYSNEIFGHGNGVCKAGNYLYLLGTGVSATNKIYKIPFDTLDSYEVIDPYGESLIPSGSNISSITYASDKNHFYITIGQPFPTLYCYEFNEDFTELINSSTYDNGSAPYGGFVTNICYWNKLLLVHYNYGKLQIFDTADMSLYKTIDLDMHVGTRIASELQWIDNYENGKLIIGTRAFIGNQYGDGQSFFATTDLMERSTEYPINLGRVGTDGKNLLFSFNIYVDNTLQTTDLLRDGSAEHPFNNLYEALQCASNPRYKNLVVYLRGDYSNDYLCICNTTNNVTVLNWDSGNKINTKGFRIENTGRVILQNITAINNCIIKNSDVYLLFTGITKTLNTYNLECDESSSLFISCRENEVELLGTSLGKIEFSNYNAEQGLVGIIDQSNNTFTDYVKCRNVSNVRARCRLSGSAYTVSTNFEFYVPLSKHDVVVQVGDKRYRLPVTGYAKTYSMPTENDVLSVTITSESSVLHYVLSTTTDYIYDCFCIF